MISACTLPNGRVSASLASRVLANGRGSDGGDNGSASRGRMSSSSVGMPAFARCAAICAPIVPAPKTAVFLTGIMTAR